MNVPHVAEWRLSASPASTATTGAATGEIRVPLSLHRRDVAQGDVPLVLSRAEAEEMYAALARALYGSFAGR